MLDFKKVVETDVSKMVEKKNGLSYLSWAMAWKEFCKIYPNATYQIVKNENGIPCFGDDKLGYMVYTRVTVEELTHEMWLPVMDFRNKTMLNPTMFDINKTVMRCLAKNLAMFGLGLNVYTGEDYPMSEDDFREQVYIKIDKLPKDKQDKLLKHYGVVSKLDLTIEQIQDVDRKI